MATLILKSHYENAERALINVLKGWNGAPFQLVAVYRDGKWKQFPRNSESYTAKTLAEYATAFGYETYRITYVDSRRGAVEVIQIDVSLADLTRDDWYPTFLANTDETTISFGTTVAKAIEQVLTSGVARLAIIPWGVGERKRARDIFDLRLYKENGLEGVRCDSLSHGEGIVSGRDKLLLAINIASLIQERLTEIENSEIKKGHKVVLPLD